MRLTESALLIKCAEINVMDTQEVERIKALAIDMAKLCTEKNGEALSASQVGISESFFVMRFTEGNYNIVVNPVYYPVGSRYKIVEGCLSFPGRSFLVKRFKKIQAEYWVLGKKDFIFTRQTYSGLVAEVFQHETQHCQGKTIESIGKEIKNG